MPTRNSRAAHHRFHGADCARRLRAAVLAACAAGALSPAVRGDTWDNSGGVLNTSWSTPSNWADDSEPATSSEPVTFPTPIPFGASVTLSAGEVAQSLTFNANYTL